MNIKFAHLADCHLGAWRIEKLNQIGYEAFIRAIDICINEKVDFVIISGDLFDISNAKVDVVDLAITELKKLRDNGIPVYGIMGSHDFSPSDKSMVRPLISADLFKNVSKGRFTDNGKLQLFFIQDPKTNIKITGLRAMKRSLEIEDYQVLDIESLEKEEGIKIFVLHTMMSELKPIEYKDMISAPKSLLPTSFTYYAGGHLHKVVPQKLKDDNLIKIDDKTRIIYPGSLSPVNFQELEQYHHGGFCIVSGTIDSMSYTSELEVKYIPIQIKEVLTLNIDCTNKSVSQVKELIKQKISSNDFNDKIVTVRIYGNLSLGKSFEINSGEITKEIRENGAYEVRVNKSKLISKQAIPISVSVGKSSEEIENTLIHQHALQTNISSINKKTMENKIHELLSILGEERESETKVSVYEEEMIAKFRKLFQLEQEDLY